MAEKKNVFTIYDDGNNGTAVISDHVMCTIAALAAVEVEGIASLKGDIDANQITKSAMNSLAKCARIIPREDNSVIVQLVLNIRYGYNLPDTTKKVQEKVKDTLESMTGLQVASVNVSISDVKIEKTPKIKKTRKAAEEE